MARRAGENCCCGREGRSSLVSFRTARFWETALLPPNKRLLGSRDGLDEPRCRGCGPEVYALLASLGRAACWYNSENAAVPGSISAPLSGTNDQHGGEREIKAVCWSSNSAEARWRSWLNAAVRKTVIHRFESDPRLHSEVGRRAWTRRERHALLGRNVILRLRRFSVSLGVLRRASHGGCW